jgi:hypothetical protein
MDLGYWKEAKADTMGMKIIDLHITLPEYDETQAFVEHCLQTGDRPDNILNPNLLAFYLIQDGIKDGAKYVHKAAKHYVCDKCTGRKMLVVVVDNRTRIGCVDCSGESVKERWLLEASLLKALRKKEKGVFNDF